MGQLHSHHPGHDDRALAGDHHGHHHHSHAADAPHPAQVARWSLLQMSVASRLGLVAVLAGAMWALAFGAMQ